MKPSSHTFSAMLPLLLLPLAIQAQDIERFKPALADVEPAVTAPEPTLPPDAGTGELSEAVVGEIKGIALWGNPAQVRADDPPPVTGVEVLDEQLLVPDEVKEALRKYVGGPLSLKIVDSIARDAVLAYRKAGMPVVDVGFPEQDVSGGVLQLVVVAGKTGKITLEGAKYFDEKIYLQAVRSKPGEILREAPIAADLRYLNRSPYRDVNLVYSPGEQFGEVDLLLETSERRPFGAYIGYDDSGNELIGVDRMFFGLEWGNVFGLDHSIGYQYTTTMAFEGLHAHAMSYRIPIASLGHEFMFLGGYVDSGASIPAAGEILETSGQSVQLSGLYMIPMPDVLDYTTEFQLGFDFKSTNNNLEFGGAQIIDSTAEIYQFSTGVTASKRQSHGRQILSNKLVWSPGDLSDHNSDDSFRQLRGLGSSDYFYWSGEFTQIVNLPKDFIFLGEIEGQVSNGNLLPSETLILGGVTSVRGFEQNIARGDEGARLRAELYGPAFDPLSWAGGDDLESRARLLAFYDYAWARNVDLLPGEPGNINLGGAGLGLDYRLARYLSAQFAYGWQVAQSGFEDDEHGRWHISATARW